MVLKMIKDRRVVNSWLVGRNGKQCFTVDVYMGRATGNAHQGKREQIWNGFSHNKI